MFKVKRVKGGATHFATSVAKAGNINGFTADESKAGVFDAATADAVAAFYSRPSGVVSTAVVTCVPLTPPTPKVEPPAVVEPPKVKPVEHHEKPTDHKPAAAKSHGHK